eukprot:CAMPEP_0181494882 /NCGR_PEP_ID=MMETSP1110-20121109/52060_1 /TAXON_ID=174948 /ORGANISM="Symbiodinium sp., Strain CCMP421" /LENGTH=238 /DNA_ID=CAMNT_0023622427 /DNA_START=49 /DNA_END=762 /DNA_ORIENTATION=+
MAHSIGHILADFQGFEYGTDYLTLSKGELVSLCPSPSAEGWSFGIQVKDGRSGWFPSQFWAPGPCGTSDLSASSSENIYDKAFLVSVRHLVGIGLQGDVPSTMSEAKIKTVVSRQQKKQQPDCLKSMVLLVEAAGGSVRLGNLAAACIALSIMTGTHKQVYQDVLNLVQRSPEFFEPVETASQKSLRQVLICLAGSAVASAPDCIPELREFDVGGSQSDAAPAIADMQMPSFSLRARG